MFGAIARLNVAGIGGGGKGDSDSSDAGACGGNSVALCDVDDPLFAGAKQKFPSAKT